MKDEPSQAATVETRRLAAIMFIDIVGFSRQMGATALGPATNGRWTKCF